MAHLLDLPNELLTAIFTSLPDWRAVTSLQRANKRLYGIWTASREKIIISVLSHEIPGFDEALAFAALDRSHSFEPYDNLQELVPSLMKNARMCATVSDAWREPYDLNEFGRTPGPWDSERVARHYYRTRQAVLAFDNPKLRRTVRKRWNAQPLEDLREHQEFSLWWLQRCIPLRDVHDMGRTEDQCEFGMDDLQITLAIPEKWYFAVETVNVIALKRLNPGRRIGKPGLWSNIACYGYQAHWW